MSNDLKNGISEGGLKIIRRFGWFFSIWFFLSFINDWLILKGIGCIPIVDALTSFNIDPYAKDWENAFAILFHAGLTVGILYFLLCKKKA